MTLALAALVPPGSVPDGPEMAAAGGCLIRLGLDMGACAGTEPFFWMPAFPLMSGLLTLITDPWAAAHAAAALTTGLLVLPLASIGRRLGIVAPAWVAGALLVATPAIRELVAQPSGRGLAWLGILGAVALVAGIRDAPAAAGRRGIAIGALLALAVLSRREAIFQAVLVGLALLPLAPRAALAATGTVTGIVLPWFATLAAAAGGLRMSGRAWEPLVYAWDAVIPHEWLLMEISMGTWGTPLREAVSRLPVEVAAAGFDASVLLPWLRYALPVAVPAWLAALAVVGALMLLRRPAGRLSIAGTIALGLPALPLAVLPNARAVELPAQNLHPVVLAALVLAAVAAGAGLDLARRRLPVGRVTGPVLAATLLAILSVANATWVARVVPVDGRTPATLTAAGTLLGDKATAVATTLSSAPAARLGDRPRAAFPSPYRVEEAGLRVDQQVLLTELDLPGARRSLELLAPDLQPIHVLADGDTWAVIFEVGSESAVEQTVP